MSPKQPLQILKLEAENVKRLKAVAIRPHGSVVKVGGKNGQGKSSTLDAIMYALGGKSLQSFAATANITRGNAAVRLFRARQELRVRVEQSCGTCATHGCYQCECTAEAHGPG